MAKTVYTWSSSAIACALPAGHVLYNKVMQFDASMEDSDRHAGGCGQISRRTRDRDLVKSSIESVFNVVIIFVGKKNSRLCVYIILYNIYTSGIR